MPTYPSTFIPSNITYSLSNPRQGSLSKLYKITFQNTSNYPTLQEALAGYSDAVTLYDHICQNDNESDSVSIITNQ